MKAMIARKKPVEVECYQYTNITNLILSEIMWVMKSFGEGKIRYDQEDDITYIHTLEGDMKVSAGDIIIKGVQGELYPCKPDIFAQTYEVIREAQDD